MTTMKKLVALLLAAMMLLAVMNVAVATEEGTATVTAISGHTFTAYQIFTGTQSESEGALGNVNWGTGINSTAFLTALKEETSAFAGTAADDTAIANVFASCTTAQEVADVLKAFDDNSPAAKKVAQIAYANKSGTGTSVVAGTNEELAKGYYLIVDTTDNLGADTAYNAALLQVTENIEIAVKTSVPTVEKKVKDTNDSTANSTTDWQDSADHDIGDTVSYQLTATLGNNLAYYETYKVEFVDTLSAGLTYNEDVAVTIDGNTVASSNYELEYENNVLTITFADVLTLGAEENSKIVVNYTATLNENAVIGSTGNPNSVKLNYSNNPNTNSEGTTTEDKVTVFTYQLTVDKVDGNGAPLAGATFTLYKKNASGTYVEVGAVEATATGDGENLTYVANWKGLDDGDYKLVETVTPAGYNTADPIEFTISATHEADSADPKLTNITVTAPVTAKSTTDEEGTVTYTGELTTTVVNNSGATLPSTGGIGTTIFYAVGGVLVLLAVVLLVTKRRVGEEN